MSPSQASSSSDGGLGPGMAGNRVCMDRYGAFASRDGGIGALAGLEGMKGGLGRGGDTLDIGCDLDVINDHSCRGERRNE